MDYRPLEGFCTRDAVQLTSIAGNLPIGAGHHGNTRRVEVRESPVSATINTCGSSKRQACRPA